MTKREELTADNIHLLESLVKYSLTEPKTIPQECGIYCIYNKYSNKCYIGQAIQIRRRVYQHLRSKKCVIHKALLKYGLVNFDFYILESGLDKTLLNDREVYWIDRFGSFGNGYNRTKGGSCQLFTQERRENHGKSSWIRTIAYNYKFGYYIECPSRKMLVEKINERGYKIKYQQIIDAIHNKSYTGDFIFGSTVAEIQSILKTKKLPTELSIFLYEVTSQKYSPKFKTTKDATEYIRKAGYKIGQSHVAVALQKKNTKIKGFLIASSQEDLQTLVNSYRSKICWYNTNTNEYFELKHCTPTKVSKESNCSLTDVQRCLRGEHKQCNGIVFAYSKIECLEKAAEYLEQLVSRQINQLERQGVFKPGHFDRLKY